MNFLEAVKELKDRRCEGIARSWWVGTVIRLNEDTTLSSLDGTFISSFLAEDWELINLKPQYEEVEVVRWLHKHKVNLYSEIEPIHNIEDWIVLKGIDRREVKPKVKRREEVTPGHNWLWKSPDMLAKRPENSKCYFEWEEEN